MNTTILIRSFFIGVIGDAILQMITKYRDSQGKNFAGLRDYFKHHGIFESLLIAGGIMFICTYLYLILGLPLSPPKSLPYLFIYGGLLDVLWRQLNLMPSLEHTYYAALNPVLSFIWGGIPMLMIHRYSRISV